MLTDFDPYTNSYNLNPPVNTDMQFLDRKKFFEKYDQLKGGHWTEDTKKGRWIYHSLVVALAKSLELKGPTEVLEMGTVGMSIVKDSDTIDHPDFWDYQGKHPTFAHDATIVPWPVESKKYRLFIALRVFQHLVPHQKEAFLEVRRISRFAIIVVPSFYRNKKIPNSKGIAYQEFIDWNNGQHPQIYIRLKNEDVYLWDFEDPSPQNVSYDPQETRIQTKHSENNPDVLEMFGASGAGKSYLAKRVIEKSNCVDTFIGGDDINKVVNLKGFSPNEWETELLREKYRSLKNRNLDTHTIKSAMIYFNRILALERYLLGLKNKSTIFLDESVYHNFGPEILKLSKQGLSPSRLFPRKLLIYIECQESVLIERMQRRRLENNEIMLHKNFSENEIREHVYQVVKAKENLFEEYIKLGLPVLKVPFYMQTELAEQNIRAFLANF